MGIVYRFPYMNIVAPLILGTAVISLSYDAAAVEHPKRSPKATPTGAAKKSNGAGKKEASSPRPTKASKGKATPDSGKAKKGDAAGQKPSPSPKPPRERSAAGNQKPARDMVEFQRVSFEGNTVATTEELRSIAQDYLGVRINKAQLRKLTGQIANHYRQKGFVAHANLKPESLATPHLEIVIFEARLGAVRLSETSRSRFPEDSAKAYITHQNPIGDYLMPLRVDKGVRILNEVPGVGATAALVAGTAPLETDVILNVQDKPVATGLVRADNAGSKSTGYARLIGTAAMNNGMGLGEQVSGLALATENSQYLRLSYDMPVGPSGLRAGAYGSTMAYSAQTQGSALHNKGNVSSYGASLTFPVLRSTSSQLSVFGGYEQRNLVDNALNVRVADRDNRAANIGLGGSERNTYGLTSYGSVLYLGHAKLPAGSPELAADLAGPKTVGAYNKATWHLGHQFPLNASTELLIAANGQFANKNLDPAEKFSLGGPQGIRAYKPLEGSGDQGWLGKVEVRHSLRGDVRVIGFVETGGIEVYKKPWAGWNAGASNVPNSYTLYGTGIGVQWQAPMAFEVSATLATPIGSNPGKPLSTDSEGNILNNANLWVNAQRAF